jgi:hypothetical protein
MKRPSVFVSSTCFDLKQVRTDIKLFLEGIGLEPILSEFNTFPVDPGVGTVENCIKAVQDRADIFVLIVGARYGSTDREGKSITNLEFLAGRGKGIPIYAFIMRSVLDILPIWETNPSADFSRAVDSPKLFDFVAALRKSRESWIFPFDTAQDIFEVLRTQLAYLFMDALSLRLRAVKSGGLASALNQLDGHALRLVIERPFGWEYSLFSTVLESELSNAKNVRRDWQYGISLGAGPRLAPLELMKVIQQKTSEGQRMAHILETLIEKALPSAFGPPGVSGVPEEIVYVAHRLVDVYRQALEWKLGFQRLDVPQGMERLCAVAGCICDNMIVEIEDYSKTLKRTIAEAVGAHRAGEAREYVNVILKVTIPDLTEFSTEMQRVVELTRSGKITADS